MGSPWAKVALAGAVITMPLVLWDVVVFWHSAMALQFRQPFREDSLNFVAWWMHGNRNLPPAALVLPFIALILATGAVLWCCPRTPAGFAAGTAVVLFAFFAFSKQAFGNYYYVVIAAMCCAIASVTAAEN